MKITYSLDISASCGLKLRLLFMMSGTQAVTPTRWPTERAPVERSMETNSTPLTSKLQAFGLTYSKKSTRRQNSSKMKKKNRKE